MSTLIDFAIAERYNINNARNLINAESIRTRDQQARTPLHLGTIHGKPDLMKLLLDAGADIEAKDECQETPLHLAACYRAEEDIVQLLVDRRANLDAVDYVGRTPLMWAALKGFSEIVGILLTAGARIDLKDNEGKTAVDQARSNTKDLILSQPPKNPPKPPDNTKPPPGQGSDSNTRLATPPPGAGTTPKDIYAFIEGRHIKPTKLSDNFIDTELRYEPFGAYLAGVSKASRPVTLDQLLKTLKDRTWLAYAVDEGIGLTFKTPRKHSRVRIVAICTPYSEHPPGPNPRLANGESLESMAFTVPTMAILAVPPSDKPNDINSNRSILQIASFHPKFGWFNFYDRERGKHGQSRWCYFGSSKDAYTPDTQGLGPFCGHANGTIVMREPEKPWLHWHSTFSSLSVPTDHPLYKDPLHRNQTTGEWYFGEPKQLATMIERGTNAWFEARHKIDLGEPGSRKPIAERVHQWIAHVCLTTSITVSSSVEQNGRNFTIPSGFFFNARALELVVPGMVKLERCIGRVLYRDYITARQQLGLVTVFKFSETNEDEVAMDSESQTWKVVTPSLEDIDGVRHILKASLLPKDVLTAMLMVDFWNPVFSYRRAQLMRYIPSTATLDNRGTPEDQYRLGVDLKNVIENQIENLELGNDSPEAEFCDLMDKRDLAKFAIDEITDYVSKINGKLESSSGVLSYMRLAETKRRLFRPAPRTQRPQHPLGEFDMMLPYASRMPDEETWLMKRDATVEKQAPPKRIWHPRNSQVHFSSAGCPFSASF